MSEEHTKPRPRRFVATGLIVFMASVLIALRFIQLDESLARWIRAFAEAALVGGLADWFAVVALFRRPLGLPIPHTAVIPRNKERIALTLGGFVQTNFFSPQNLTPRLQNARLARTFIEWLRREEIARRLAEELLLLAPHLSRIVSHRGLDAVIERLLTRTIDEGNPAEWLRRSISALADTRNDTVLLAPLLAGSAQFIRRNEWSIREALRDDLPWWLPEVVHDTVAARVLQKLGERLTHAANDPSHPLRMTVRRVLERVALDIAQSPELEPHLRSSLRTILHEERTRELLRSSLVQLLNSATTSEQRAATTRYLSNFIQSTAASMANEPELISLLDSELRLALLHIAEKYGDQLAALVTETIRDWDAQTLSRKIESEVAHDLQFIRLNGTLVGGLLGLLIEALF